MLGSAGCKRESSYNAAHAQAVGDFVSVDAPGAAGRLSL